MQLTQKELKSLFDYDPLTGVFTRKIRVSIASKVGEVVGCKHKTTGYLVIVIRRKQYRAHRLAWLYMTGEQPPEYIDHIDRDPINNRWENLRACSAAENTQNQGVLSRNTSGYKGVYWESKLQKWAARIMANGKRRYLGSCDDKHDAAELYNNEAFKLHGEFAFQNDIVREVCH